MTRRLEDGPPDDVRRPPDFRGFAREAATRLGFWDERGISAHKNDIRASDAERYLAKVMAEAWLAAHPVTALWFGKPAAPLSTAVAEHLGLTDAASINFIADILTKAVLV